jgi:hypothetical protein
MEQVPPDNEIGDRQVGQWFVIQSSPYVLAMCCFSIVLLHSGPLVLFPFGDDILGASKSGREVHVSRVAACLYFGECDLGVERPSPRAPSLYQRKNTELCVCTGFCFELTVR